MAEQTWVNVNAGFGKHEFTVPLSSGWACSHCGAHQAGALAAQPCPARSRPESELVVGFNPETRNPTVVARSGAGTTLSEEEMALVEWLRTEADENRFNADLFRNDDHPLSGQAVEDYDKRAQRYADVAALVDRLSSVATGEEPTGISLIAAERKRQVDAEGWDATHDDTHGDEELAIVAALYATPEDLREVHGPRGDLRGLPLNWPDTWSDSWWKPSDDRVRDLVKAGALIAAEIDRLNRASTPSDPVERREGNT